SPSDGFYRDELVKIGVTVIVDELLLTRHETVGEFARNFDLAVVNTIVGWPFVLQNMSQLDCYWYLHESDAIVDYARGNPNFVKALQSCKAVWVNGLKAKTLTEQLRPDIAVIEYGIRPLLQQQAGDRSATTKIGVFGSYEPRKGQDLAVAAFQQLSDSLREN